MTATDLPRLFADLARGTYPAADGRIEVVPRPVGAIAAVFAFTAHHVVAADLPPDWVREHCDPSDLSAPLGPRFLSALADRTGASPGAIDLVLCRLGEGETPAVTLIEVVDPDHPRVGRARRYRRDVRVFQTPDGSGLVVVGRGVAGRWEAGFEVQPGHRGRGLGRELAGAAAGLVPAGEAMYLQVAVGNGASLRAVLRAGYTPVGAEVLLTQARVSRNAL
jgi:GNAT superfamily N-acetyltransferase